MEKYKKGTKVILKNNRGFENQMDRNKYNNMEVTMEWVRLNDDGTLDIFFIEEDDGRYEWSLDDIVINIKRQVEYFHCELERINEGLQNRNIDADSVISITDNGVWVSVWYRVNV